MDESNDWGLFCANVWRNVSKSFWEILHSVKWAGRLALNRWVVFAFWVDLASLIASMLLMIYLRSMLSVIYESKQPKTEDKWIEKPQKKKTSAIWRRRRRRRKTQKIKKVVRIENWIELFLFLFTRATSWALLTSLKELSTGIKSSSSTRRTDTNWKINETSTSSTNVIGYWIKTLGHASECSAM